MSRYANYESDDAASLWLHHAFKERTGLALFEESETQATIPRASGGD
jgi:hypothetical protein